MEITSASNYREVLAEMLCNHAVKASDGFRQWLYKKPYGPQADYSLSHAALDSIEQAVACEPDVRRALELRIKNYG